LLGRSLREELGDLKGSRAARTIVARNGRGGEQPFDLIYGGLQESIAGELRRERMGVLGVILRENDKQ
jgi:hypothetical protein